MKALRVQGIIAELVDVKNELEALQAAVGGYIESLTLIPGKAVMIVNEEGVILNLIFMILGVVIFVDYFIMSSVEGLWGTICSVCFFVMGIWLSRVMLRSISRLKIFRKPWLYGGER